MKRVRRKPLGRYVLLLVPLSVGVFVFSHLFYARCSLPGPARLEVGSGEVGLVIRYGSWRDGRLGAEVGWSPHPGQHRFVLDPFGALGMVFVPSWVLVPLAGLTAFGIGLASRRSRNEAKVLAADQK